MFVLYIFDIICFITGMWKSLTSTKVKTDFAKVNGNITIIIVLHIFNLIMWLVCLCHSLPPLKFCFKFETENILCSPTEVDCEWDVFNNLQIGNWLFYTNLQQLHYNDNPGKWSKALKRMIFNIVEVWRPIFTWQTIALRNGQVMLLMLAILKFFITYSDPMVSDTKYRLCFLHFQL